MSKRAGGTFVAEAAAAMPRGGTRMNAARRGGAQRDSVGPSFGSFASGQARKLISAAGPPFPHANRFAGFV